MSAEVSEPLVAPETAAASDHKMRVLEARAFRGPSIYAYRRVIRVTLDLGELENYPTTKLGSFTERLIETIPSLHEHTCSYGEPGGFVRRLRDGTWLGARHRAYRDRAPVPRRHAGLLRQDSRDR
jgi:cyanophycin synthetase